jgi:hypothetical protein
MNNQTSSIDAKLEFIRIYIVTRSLFLTIFAVGMCGNILNIVVFVRKKFHANSCSIYFIAYSLNNLLNLTIGLFLWSLTMGFDWHYEYKSLTYCKIRRYFTHANFLLSSCLLTMASINRCARVRQAQLTFHMHRYKQLCQRRTSYILTLLTVLFCLIINLHIPFLFVIEQKQCYARSGISRIFFDIFFLIFYAICPPLLMIAVNIITLKQIRSIRRLVHPKISSREYNLIALVISHSISNAIFTLPFTINKFISYTFADSKQTQWNQLISSITLLIAFMNPSLSFFIYTLTTRSFRHEFICVCNELYVRIRSWYCQNKFIDIQQQ